LATEEIPSKPVRVPTIDGHVVGVVAEIMEAVPQRGDEAVREYSSHLDDWSPSWFRLTKAQVRAIVDGMPSLARSRIEFCETRWVSESLRPRRRLSLPPP
jgi:histidinol dehydrogenase